MKIAGYGDGGRYLDRYVVFRTPLLGVHLHRFSSADDGPDFHDHPRVLRILVLRGGYDEELAAADGGPPLRRRWSAGSAHRLRLGDRHRIVGLRRTPTWTLVVVGRKLQDWGFWVGGRFVGADDYLAAREAAR